MAKINKFLAFATFVGAACAATFYALKKNQKRISTSDTNSDTSDFFEKKNEREYVSLNAETEEAATEGSDQTKEALKQKLDEVATEYKEKIQADADGVGLVKEEADASEFEFEDFATEEDEIPIE